MSLRLRWIVSGLIVVIVVKLGLLGWPALAPLLSNHASQPNVLPSVAAPARAHAARPFTPAEVSAFLAQAKQTRGIADPLQRCLAFPDPPGSHWAHDTVVAYCHYMTQSVISVAELTTLIQDGHADEVDKRFADALQLQRSQPDARGLVDRTFIRNFRDSSSEMRGILDAWIRQSPNSAFAHAASGTAYVIAAHDARGAAAARYTARTNFESMGRLLESADDDFSKALAINPRLTAAYAGMVEAGTYGNGAYALKAAKKGLAIDPANFAIYVRLMLGNEPKWGGSITLMQQVASRAQIHLAQNPLLSLLEADAPAYAASGDDCDCYNAVTQVPDYRSLFDRVADFRPMATAGQIASNNDHTGAAIGLIYAAEAARFDPKETPSRITVVYELAEHGEAGWAKEEADQLVVDSPSSAKVYDARGKASETLLDYSHAVDDYRTAFGLDPTESWPLSQTGLIEIHKTHEWDLAWANADQLIQLFPDLPDGWILRLSIQKDQPRAGFHETMVYFLAHFSHDPNQQAAVREVRQWLAEGK